MNEERVAIMNAALQGRITLTDAIHLLETLLYLEGESRFTVSYTVESPCKLPPWRRGTAGKSELAQLMFGEDVSGLLQNCHGPIVLGLENGILDSACVCLAALDVMYLSRFWTEGRRVAITFGGVELFEKAGQLETGWFDLATSGECQIAWDLFAHPFPIAAGGPGVSSVEALETELGVFTDCLKVERQTDNALTVWLARGIGPVRVTLVRADGTHYTRDLTAYSPSLSRQEGLPHDAPHEETEFLGSGYQAVRDADSYLPRTPGRWWCFDSSDHTAVRCEIWRALAHAQEEACWLSFASYVGKYEGDTNHPEGTRWDGKG